MILYGWWWCCLGESKVGLIQTYLGFHYLKSWYLNWVELSYSRKSHFEWVKIFKMLRFHLSTNVLKIFPNVFRWFCKWTQLDITFIIFTALSQPTLCILILPTCSNLVGLIYIVTVRKTQRAASNQILNVLCHKGIFAELWFFLQCKEQDWNAT